MTSWPLAAPWKSRERSAAMPESPPARSTVSGSIGEDLIIASGQTTVSDIG